MAGNIVWSHVTHEFPQQWGMFQTAIPGYFTSTLVLTFVLWKALKECEELTKKYSNTTLKNEQLSEECRRYMGEFKRMEEMIKNLKREIDERNRQASVTGSVLACLL